MARAGSRLFALIASLSVGAAALTIAVTVLGPVPAAAPTWSLAVVLTFVLVSDQAAAHVRIGRDTHSVTLGDMALASTALLLPVPVIVAAKVIGMTALLIRLRKDPTKVAFNAANSAFEAAVFCAVVALGAQVVRPHSALFASVVIAAIVAGSAIQASSVRLAIRWAAGPASHRQSLLPALAGAAASASVGVVMTELLRQSPLYLIPTAIVGGVMWASYRAYVRLLNNLARMESVQRLTRELSAPASVWSLEGQLLDAARELTTASTVALIRPGRHEAVTGTGEDPRVVDAASLDRWWRDARSGAAARARRRGSGGQLALADGPADAVAVAIVGEDGQDAGTFVASDRLGDDRRFDDDDIAALETLANHAGVALRNAQHVEELQAEAAFKERQAREDPVTGLANRRALIEHIDALVRNGRPVSLFLAYLTDRREVDLAFGHAVGDELIRTLGGRLIEHVGAGDWIVAALNGFELVVAGPDDGVAVATTGDRWRHALSEPVDLVGVTLAMPVRIAAATSSGASGTELLRNADTALARATRDRRPFAVYDEVADAASPRRLQIAADLARALRCGELSMHYQPLVDLRTGALHSVEALMRWQHAELGWVRPDEFIPVAERTGMIGRLTEYALSTSVRERAKWQHFAPNARVAVNVSAAEIASGGLVDQVMNAGDGGHVHHLKIEVTESSVMVDPDLAIAALGALRDTGIHIAVDDFGTGYSSLAYLRDLPINEVKLDRSFCRGLSTDQGVEHIVGTSIRLAQGLGLSVVAEGVEDEATASRLTSLGCDVGQGYYWGRPGSVDALGEWLAASVSRAHVDA